MLIPRVLCVSKCSVGNSSFNVTSLSFYPVKCYFSQHRLRSYKYKANMDILQANYSSFFVQLVSFLTEKRFPLVQYLYLNQKNGPSNWTNRLFNLIIYNILIAIYISNTAISFLRPFMLESNESAVSPNLSTLCIRLAAISLTIDELAAVCSMIAEILSTASIVSFF